MGAKAVILDDVAPQFHPGDILAERFAIIRFIARGAMGEVYEALDRVLDNTSVALKTIAAKSALLPEERLRFKREVKIAREITHPNVCPTYDFYECEQPFSTCFITMKLLRGETLAQRLKRDGALSQVEALLIARQLCDGLAAAHAAGVIHRDLKPSNIMLEGSGPTLKAIITDFGVALNYEMDETIPATRDMAGTRGYIAPEVIGGDSATPASDLYSLGVVLHEAILSYRPKGDKISAVDAQRIPESCLTLIAACLSADPAVRNRSFARAVQTLRSDETVVTVRPRLTRRNFIGWGALAAVAGGVGAVISDWDDIWHPLPQRRFVAVLQFPPVSDPKVTPLVQGMIEAIESELSRAEAYDRNLFVTAVHSVDGTDAAAIRKVRDISGANLALVAQGSIAGDSLHLVLKLLDASTSAVLRLKNLVTSQLAIDSSRRSAVKVAAELLNVRLRGKGTEQPSLATSSDQAYKLFQTAENLRQQPNDAGLEKAIETYRDALDADPNYAIAYAMLAIAYCRLYSITGEEGALQLAKRNADAGLKVDPNLSKAHVALSSFYDQEGNKQEALNEIAKALTLDPTNVTTLFFQAQIYWRMNRFSDAEQIYHRILDQRPNHWSAYNELGCVLLQEGRYREALSVFRAESIVNPRAYLAFSNLGDASFKLGNLDDAMSNYKKSLDLRPNEWAYGGISCVLRARGDYSGALPNQLKATEVMPANDVNWLNLGDTYVSLHKQQQAREAYLKAKKTVESSLAVDAADSSAWLRLALYSIKTNQPGDPLTILDKASPLDLLDLDSQIVRARVYELLGEREKAKDTLRKAFGKGLTSVEIAFIPDLQVLKKDPAFPR